MAGHRGNATPIPIRTRGLPSRDEPGIADARFLPDSTFASSWEAVFLDAGLKDQVAQTAAASLVMRNAVAFERLPLHGIILLVGPPGTGKTTLGRGLADRIARLLPSMGQFAFLEINPHALASSSLGRSQQAVEQLFSTVITETASGGPVVVFIDEIETIATDRSQLSFDTNPADVHRAVDAALVGLDRVARAHTNVVFIATSNFPKALDGALTSRADAIFTIDLPNETARRAIIVDTTHAVRSAFPGALPDDERALGKLVAATEGYDGRQLRKLVAAAVGTTKATLADPSSLRYTDLVEAAKGPSK